MDAKLLTQAGFWDSVTPVFAGDVSGCVPDDGRLSGHVLFSTSGSMGLPRWVSLSKRALLVSADAVNRHLAVDEGSCWGLALPVRHVGGFGVAARAFAAGCRMAEFDCKWNPDDFLRWLVRERVTHTSLVPTQVYDLVVKGCSAPAGLVAVVVGGGRLDDVTGRAARNLGWPVLASYGMTECSSQVATQTIDSLNHIYQNSPIPVLPHWQVEAVSGQGVRLSGPALFSGVLVADGASWIYRKREGEWFEPSDRVRFENGLITPLGRMDLMVKVLGELVSVEEVESEISAIAGGMFSPGSFAVAAVSDPRAEHLLVPVFESSIPRESVLKVLGLYQEQAPGYRRLVEPVYVRFLPKSPLGKILRSELADVLATGGGSV